MIDIISNSKSAVLAARGFALGALKTPNGMNALAGGLANMGIQGIRAAHEDRPFGMYGATKSFAIGAGMGLYGGMALRVGATSGYNRSFGMNLMREARRMGGPFGRANARMIGFGLRAFNPRKGR